MSTSLATGIGHHRPNPPLHAGIYTLTSPRTTVLNSKRAHLCPRQQYYLMAEEGRLGRAREPQYHAYTAISYEAQACDDFSIARMLRTIFS